MQLCLLTQSPIPTCAHTKQVTSANKHAHNKPHTSREVEADAAVVRKVRGRAESTPPPDLSPITNKQAPHTTCTMPHPCCCKPHMQLCTRRCKQGAAGGLPMKHTHTPCCTKQDLCCLLHNHYSKLQHLVQHPAAEGLVESPLLDPPTNCKCTGTHEHAIAAISGCAHQAT